MATTYRYESIAPLVIAQIPTQVSPRDQARALVDAFAMRTAPGAFTKIPRADVVTGLRDRIDNPGNIDQGGSSLCGPANISFWLIKRDPVKWAKYVIDLYEKGWAHLGDLTVAPGKDLKALVTPGTVKAVDWIAIASLRDSENTFLDYDNVSAWAGAAGITMPGTMERWFRAAGFSDIVSDTNLVHDADEANIHEAVRLWKEGYAVSLLIHANMLQSEYQDNVSMFPDHWVGVTSDFQVVNDQVKFAVFSWGDEQWALPDDPAKPMGLATFLDSYYGYVAAKY